MDISAQALGRVKKRGRTPCWRPLVAVWTVMTLAPAGAHAQFLRLGPFDFTAKGKLGGVYSTNVERERPSEAQASRRDYYLVVGLSLQSQAAVSPNTDLSIDTGIEVEKHFIRHDLDNANAPFGRLRLASLSEFGHLTVRADASWERRSESGTTEFVPGGRSSKTRNPSDRYEYNLGAEWERGPFSFGASIGQTRTRYQKAEFQDGDENSTKVDYFAKWQVYENLSLNYRVQRTKTELVNKPDDNPTWDSTETISLDWRLSIIERPKLTYSLGLEKEKTKTDKGQWEPTHTFTLSDEWALTPRLQLRANAVYTYEKNKESDDITFTYNFMLQHDVSRSVRQTLRLTREPRATFGSTTDTDTTTYGYDIQYRDFLLYNLNLSGMVTYEVDRPVETEKETILTYTGSATYLTELSRRLHRELKYEYSREDDSLDPELLVEHRVTLTYEYTF